MNNPFHINCKCHAFLYTKFLNMLEIGLHFVLLTNLSMSKLVSGCFNYCIFILFNISYHTWLFLFIIFLSIFKYLFFKLNFKKFHWDISLFQECYSSLIYCTFINLLIKCLLSIYCEPGSILGIGGTTENKQNSLPSWSLDSFYWEKRNTINKVNK